MRGNLMMSIAVSALALTLSPAAALAQHGGGGGGMGGYGGMSSGMQMQQGDLDRTQDRLRDKTKDKTGDKDRDRDQDRDRDRLNTAQAVDSQLTGLSLLTNAERTQFQSEMRAAKTVEERNQIRAEHQNMIQQRAQEMGVQAPMGAGMGPGSGMGAGAGGGGGMGAGMGSGQSRGGYMLMQMLTDQERAQFFNRMQTAQTVQERQTIRNEMQVMARDRAREMGVDVPDWYGAGAGPR